MNEKGHNVRIKGNLRRYMRWPLILTILLTIVNIYIYSISIKAGIILTIFTIIYLAISVLIYAVKGPAIYRDLVNFATEYGIVQKKMLKELPIPYVILDKHGRILWVNNEFNNIFEETVKLRITKHHIWTIIPDIAKCDIEDMKEDSFEKTVNFNERCYNVEISNLDISDVFKNSDIVDTNDDEGLIAVTFFDQTEINRLMKSNIDDRMVAGLIYIDNYDEALESIEDVRKSLLTALIDRKINKYIGNVEGIVKKIEKDKYFIIFKQKHLPNLQSSKFSILDDVKTVNIGNEIPVTVSIGLGVGGNNYIQNCDFSRIAIDLALGRGGDQAIVKDLEKVYYYGGKSKTVEKNTRVKARVKAHAFRELLDTKDKVLIMGHSIADVDSFGAAIGLYRAIKTLGKRSNIVINTVNSSLRPIFEKFKPENGYEEGLFINSQEAVNQIDDNTLLVVVDVNKPNYTECPELIGMAKSIVVLDHHRQSSDIITGALLSYIEPYASSTCEMVSEIIQYMSEEIKLKPQEADAIYGGIVIDTNNFVSKTGVRTFEAAAYLRKCGADVVRVKKMFRDTETEYKAKADAIANAEIIEQSFAITECTSQGLESPTIIGAQAANELLNIRGIKASFVISSYNGKMYISARSIDEINVQLIMERLGGGGHLNIAGAQIENCNIEETKSILKKTIKQMLEEGDI